MSGDNDFDDELFALAAGDDDADVEEGEASDVSGASSPNSLGSDAMDESDSDRDDEPSRNSDVPYPLEGKYVDAKDKARINAMTQLEREAILGQRLEEMATFKFQSDLRRRATEMQTKSKAMEDSRKRGADTQDSDDEHRESRRQTVKARTNDKLEAYKREREQRGQQRQRHDDRRNGHRRSSSGDRDGGSDVDAEGESEVDWDDRAKAVSREDPVATLNHFQSVRVGRAFFAEVCFYPGFEEAMAGTFARVGAGADSQQRVLYKMAQIKGFTPGKPYAFDGKNGQKLATDMYVICQHGATKKEYQFQYLSNGPLTEADLDAYKQGLSETNSKLPTQNFLKKKYEDIKNLRDRFWTDADINARIEKSKKFSHILKARKSDYSAPKISSQSETAAARIAEINRQNRKTEQERVRKALLEERNQQLRERKRQEHETKRRKKEEEVAKKAAEEKALKKKHLEVDPLFDGDSSRASTPKPSEKKKTERKGLPTFRKPKMEDDIIAAMDIGVEIDI